jgi:hypothetical protein
LNADEGIVALPFYEPRHAELARRISEWCASNELLWAAPADPEQTGLRIVQALGKDGWLVEPHVLYPDESLVLICRGGPQAVAEGGLSKQLGRCRAGGKDPFAPNMRKSPDWTRISS